MHWFKLTIDPARHKTICCDEPDAAIMIITMSGDFSGGNDTIDARRNEEASTARRADILHVSYTDTSLTENKPVFRDVLAIDQMRQYRIIPLSFDRSNILFGITTTTSQQTMNALVSHFTDQKVAFTLISETGYQEYMNVYDPPKQVVYQDIDIKDAGTDRLVGEVSGMLEQIRADDMLAYLVSQAHLLNASDIHLETQTDHARIRLRIDGVLHPVARLNLDKYSCLLYTSPSPRD